MEQLAQGRRPASPSCWALLVARGLRLRLPSGGPCVAYWRLCVRTAYRLTTDLCNLQCTHTSRALAAAGWAG